MQTYLILISSYAQTMLELFTYSLSYEEFALLLFGAFLIGMAKTGVHGVGMLTVPIMALIFGGKISSGLVLPMLIMADLFAVRYYHRHANWRYLIKLLPSAKAQNMWEEGWAQKT